MTIAADNDTDYKHSDCQDLRNGRDVKGAGVIQSNGTVKATLGSVNVPVVVAGQAILPGDAIIADDDGVVVVAHASVDKAIELGEKRVANETSKRERLAAGELGLDIYNMRPELEKLGLRYLDDLPKA